MFKKYVIFVCCFFFPQNYGVIKIVTSMDQKTDNLYAWMVWKTSKEYTISYHPNKDFKKFDLEPNMSDIIVPRVLNTVIVNNEGYTYLRKKNSLNHGWISINLCHDIALGIDAADDGDYCLYHYRASDKNKTFSTEKILKIPELNGRSYGLFCESADKTGLLVMSVLKKGILAIIVPKKIPEKKLLIYDNLCDASFNYL